MIFRFKELLKDKRLKVQDIAPVVGVTPQHLSALVSERYMPSVDVLLKLADVMGVHVSELFAPPADACQMEGRIVCPHCGNPIELHTLVYASIPKEKPARMRNPSGPKEDPEDGAHS